MKNVSKVCLFLVLMLVSACTVNPGSASQFDARQISSLMNASVNRSNSFSGLVVAQQTKEIQKDQNKVVKEVFVKEGDEVKEDTVLFNYDTDAMSLEVQKAQLEIERMNNENINSQNQITNLVNERAKAPASQQLSYTIEIQTLEASINETNYNIGAKQVELNRLNESLSNANVVAGLEGIVQSIASDGTDPYANPSNAFITILQTGNFRVKGNVNELNLHQINQGQQVFIRSRIDESKVYPGMIESIEMNSPVQGDNQGYVSSEMDQSSRYPFYVSLENSDELFLGQHVYIELDQGQTQEREGVWIFSQYINFDEEGNIFVYKAENGVAKKQPVELGEMSDVTGELQIISGLELDDYIILPHEELEENMKVNVISEDN